MFIKQHRFLHKVWTTNRVILPPLLYCKPDFFHAFYSAFSSPFMPVCLAALPGCQSWVYTHSQSNSPPINHAYASLSFSFSHSPFSYSFIASFLPLFHSLWNLCSPSLFSLPFPFASPATNLSSTFSTVDVSRLSWMPWPAFDHHWIF